MLEEFRKEVLECIWNNIVIEIPTIPGSISEDMFGRTLGGIPGGTSAEILKGTLEESSGGNLK